MRGLRPMRSRNVAGAKRAVSPARAALTLSLALLALVAQWFVAASHDMPTRSAISVTSAAAAELKATFGETAVLCVQAGDEAPTPGDKRPCDAACPLCQMHSGALALWAPESHFLSVAFDGAATPFTWPLTAAPTASRRLAQAQPRAPPSEA